MGVKEVIPFFVVDRFASLEIIKHVTKEWKIKFGLMTHANTSENFQNYFRDYPCLNFEFCYIKKTECPFRNNLQKCNDRKEILRNIVKICDSGIFTKEGFIKDNYEELFATYKKMKCNYGIIRDYLKRKKETVKSARQAIKIYKKNNYKFKLIGVAQGNSLNEYIKCYGTLKKLGYKYVAIGGLLKKIENSARYVRVEDENFLQEVFKKIRAKYPKDWLFALGSYHPDRHNLFKSLNIYGGDYKGWIFNYTPKEVLIRQLHKRFEDSENEIQDKELLNLKHKCERKLKKIFSTKKQIIELKGASNTDKRKKLRKKLKNNWDDLLKIEFELIKFRGINLLTKIPSEEYKNDLEKLKEILNSDQRKLRFEQTKRYNEQVLTQQIGELY